MDVMQKLLFGNIFIVIMLITDSPACFPTNLVKINNSANEVQSNKPLEEEAMLLAGEQDGLKQQRKEALLISTSTFWGGAANMLQTPNILPASSAMF